MAQVELVHNHWTASISSLGAPAPHEFFKLEILVFLHFIIINQYKLTITKEPHEIK